MIKRLYKHLLLFDYFLMVGFSFNTFVIHTIKHMELLLLGPYKKELCEKNWKSTSFTASRYYLLIQTNNMFLIMLYD